MMRFGLLLLVLGTTPLLAQADPQDSLIRPLPVVTLEIRKVLGWIALVPAGTLSLLYLFRPRPYVLAWVMAAISASAMLLSLSFDSASRMDDTPQHLVAGPWALAAWSISAMLFGASVRFGGLWFRADAVLPRGTPLVAAALAGWVAAAVTFLRPGAALVPAFALMCLWQGKGAVAYLRVARRYRFVGALLCGIGAFGIIGVNVAVLAVAAATGGVSQTSTNVAYANLAAASFLVLGMHLLVFEDVIDELRTAAAELARGRDEMRAMAVTDPLTGCYNRRFLEEIAEHELEQHRRYGVPLSLMYLDIDHFKAINDTHGHNTGDAVLQTLGTILRELTRQADYVFRWGGDEFLVLLSADEDQGRAKAQQIRQAFLESAIVRGLPDGVDLSIGCVAVPPGTEHFEPLIDQADRAMYRRKRTLGG